MEVACGQCLGCRLDRAQMWAARIIHESALHDHSGGNAFVTLTYRSPWECDTQQRKEGLHVPLDGSLNKKHFQLFMKRLRKNTGKKIRYFHCGEYGDENLRPHYHAILFNYFPDDAQLIRTHDGISLYSSNELETTWGYGFVTIGEVTYESAAYTARYCLKKVTGPQAEEHYLRFDEYGVCHWVEPEYCTMSRKPGIGRDWYEMYNTDIYPSLEMPIPGKGNTYSIPRYYDGLLQNADPDTHEKVHKVRQQFRNAHKEDYTPERLMDKYKVRKASLQQLQRNL